MPHEHNFKAVVKWIGAAQGPAISYQSYSREYLVEIEGKADLTGSAAAPFRGDASLHNPEDMLLASLSACHMLSYLALAVREGIVVTSYTDEATATMAFKDSKMRFTEATLRPKLTVAPGADLDKAQKLHHEANQQCFIASSVNFEVSHEPEITLAPLGERVGEGPEPG